MYTGETLAAEIQGKLNAVSFIPYAVVGDNLRNTLTFRKTQRFFSYDLGAFSPDPETYLNYLELDYDTNNLRSINYMIKNADRYSTDLMGVDANYF